MKSSSPRTFFFGRSRYFRLRTSKREHITRPSTPHPLQFVQELDVLWTNPRYPLPPPAAAAAAAASSRFVSLVFFLFWDDADRVKHSPDADASLTLLSDVGRLKQWLGMEEQWRHDAKAAKAAQKLDRFLTKCAERKVSWIMPREVKRLGQVGIFPGRVVCFFGVPRVSVVLAI